MSHSKRSSIEDDREEAEQEVRAITAPLRKQHHSTNGKVPPSIIGWKLDCPHCNEKFKLTFHDDGTYDLTVEG